MAAEGGKEFSSSKKYLVVKQTCGCHGIRSVMIGVDDYGDQYSWEYELSVTQIVSGKSTRFDRG
jgi:hypothetical protein